MIKFYIQCYPNINLFMVKKCLSTFGENRSRGGSVVSLFPKFSGHADLGFQWMKLHKNLQPKYISLETTRLKFGYIYSSVKDTAVSLFPKFFWQFYLGFYCIESYKILHAIYLLLYKMILIYFFRVSLLGGAVITIFPYFWENADFVLY